MLETLRHDNWTFFGIPTAQVVSLAFVVPAIVDPDVPASGRAIDDDPPTFPAVATWGPSAGRSTRTRSTTTSTTTRATTTCDGEIEAEAPTTPTPDGRSPATAPTTPADDAASPSRPPADDRARAGARTGPPPAAAGRVSPEALAAARGGAVEGLEWLGRAPRRGRLDPYRLLRLVARFVIFVVFRFRIRTLRARSTCPRGGYLLVGAAHRGWMDPFVVMHALPTEPRAWFLGSAPSTFTTRWREWLIHRVGGLLPVWRGGVGVDQHVASARAVVANGAVFVQMPEGTVSGPPGAPRAVPHRLGDHRAAHRRPDRAVRDGRHRGALPRQADGARGSCRRPRPAPLAGLAPDAPLPGPGLARGARRSPTA